MVEQAPTIADLSLSGYLFYPVQETGVAVGSRFSNIAAWLKRVQALPGWADPYEILPAE